MRNKSKPQLTLVINNEGMFKNKECRMYSRLPMKSMGGLKQSKVKDMNGVGSRKEVKIKYEQCEKEGKVRKEGSVGNGGGEEGNKRLKRLRMERERKGGGGLNRSCGDVSSGYGKRKEEEKGGVSETNKSSNSHYNQSSVHNTTTDNKNANTNSNYIQLYSIKHKTHISLICDKFINIKANSFSNINTNNNNNSKFNILSIVNNTCFEIHNNNISNNNHQPLPPPNKSRNPHTPPNPPKKSQCKFDSFDSMYFSSSIHINQAPPYDQPPPSLNNNNITITEREFISNPQSTRKHPVLIPPPFAANRPTLHPIELPCANVSQDTIDVPLSSLRAISPSFETALTELTTNAVCIMNLFNQHKSSFTNEVLLLLHHLMNQNINYISQLTQLNKSKVIEYKLDFLTKNNNMCITLLKQVHVMTTCNLIQNILKENIDMITEITHSHSNNNN